MPTKNDTKTWWVLALSLAVIVTAIFTVHRCSESGAPVEPPPLPPTPIPTPPEPPDSPDQPSPNPNQFDALVEKLDEITDAKINILQDDEISMWTAASELRNIKYQEKSFLSELTDADLSPQEKAAIDKAQRAANSRVTNKAVQSLVDYYEEEIDILFNVPPALKPEKMRELQSGRLRVLDSILDGVLESDNRKAAEEDERVNERKAKRDEALKRIKLTGTPL